MSNYDTSNIRYIVFLILAFMAHMTFAQGLKKDIDVQEKISVTADLRTRFEFKENRDFDKASKDVVDFVGTRARLNFSFYPTEELEMFVQPQFSGVWGQTESVFDSSGIQSNGVLSSGALRDPYLFLHQAYAVWKLSEKSKLILGRQELSYGDHLVLGNVGYSNIGRSFDAIRMSTHLKQGVLDVFYSRLAEDDFNASTYSGNDGFSGVYYALKKNESFIREQDFYSFWLRQAKNTGSSDFNFATVGFRLKTKAGIWDKRVEAGFQIGERQGSSMQAWMIDVEEGVTFAVKKGLRFALEYSYASGDDPGSSKYTRWHSLFSTAHKWHGYLDFLGRQNLQSAVAHIKLNMDQKFNIALDLHRFWRANSNDFIYGLASESVVNGQGLSPTISEKNIGDEINVLINYNVNSNIQLQTMGGVFFPRNYIKAAIGDDVSYFSYMQMHFKM